MFERLINMARLDEQQTTLIVEKVEGVENPAKNPTVLSCGGIFIPRPREMKPGDPLYHILNVANANEPTKIVTGIVPQNLLQAVLQKESLN